MNLRCIQVILLSALGVAASSASSLANCGGSFDVPKDHFDGVDEFGYVSYWDKIADIDIGEDTPLPLVIGFKSNRETSSPYLGHGWVMPLLDSYMIQTGENTFEIMKPTGYTSGFGRDPKSPTTIGGVKGWKGEIGSNTIKVWAPCGWSLTYTMGRLTEMGTPKGKRVTVKRDHDGQVKDITMDGRVLVKVIKNIAGGVEGMEIDGNPFEITLAERPWIQNVEGKNLIVGKNISLAGIATEINPSDPTMIYKYGVDKYLQPTMKVIMPGNREREIIWNATNDIIYKDGDWIYEIILGESRFDNAALKRVDVGQGIAESFHYDGSQGRETIVDKYGKKQVMSWFTSGRFKGKLRTKATYDKTNKVIQEMSRYYDELGDVIGEMISFGNGNIINNSFYPDGSSMQVTKNEQFMLTRLFSKSGDITAEKISTRK